MTTPASSPSTSPMPSDSSSPPSDAPWRHLHVVSLAFSFVEVVRPAVGVAVTLVAAQWWMRHEMVLPAVASIFFAVGVLYAVMSWLFTGYRLTSHGVEWRQGMFKRSHRFVSYDQIHAIETSASPLRRLFGSVRLVLMTGDSTDGGIVLEAVPERLRDDIERRRTPHLAQHRAEHGVNAGEGDSVGARESARTVLADPAVRTQTPYRSAQPHPALRVSTGDIVKFALTDVHVIAAALVVWQVIAKFGDVLPDWMNKRVEHMQEQFVETAIGNPVYAAEMLVVALVALLTFSLLRCLARYHGMEVRREGDMLVIERGLFTRNHAMIPVHRIRTLVVERSLLRRMVHLSSVRIGLASGEDSEGAGDSVTTMLVPVIADARVYPTLRGLLPEWRISCPPIQRTGAGLLRYFVAMPVAMLMLGIVSTVALVWTTGDIRWWAFALMPCWALWWLATRVVKYHAEGFALLPDAAGALPHRIAMRAGSGCGLVMLFTRRSCAQMSRMTVPFWRMRSGIGRFRITLFVANGPDTLMFTRIRRTTADILSAWVRAATPAATSPNKPGLQIRADERASARVESANSHTETPRDGREWNTR